MKTIEHNFPVLESCELFAGLSSSIRSVLLANARTRAFKRHKVIFFAGDAISSVALLVQGSVKLTQLSEQGSVVILRLHAPGQIVGVPNWRPGDIHSLTAQTLEPSVVLFWEAQLFQSFLDRFPQFHRNAIELIQRMIESLERRYCVVSTASRVQRLADGLVHALGQLGLKVNGHVELYLTQEELGQMTAMSQFEVSRVLKIWEQTGLVKLRREVIAVQNMEGLLELCKDSSRCQLLPLIAS